MHDQLLMRWTKKVTHIQFIGRKLFNLELVCIVGFVPYLYVRLLEWRSLSNLSNDFFNFTSDALVIFTPRAAKLAHLDVGSFESLPPEARQTCRVLIDQLVGFSNALPHGITKILTRCGWSDRNPKSQRRKRISCQGEKQSSSQVELKLTNPARSIGLENNQAR